MTTRIALVDDDQNILTSVSLTLESEGFEIDCYHDGHDAGAQTAQAEAQSDKRPADGSPPENPSGP